MKTIEEKLKDVENSIPRDLLYDIHDLIDKEHDFLLQQNENSRYEEVLQEQIYFAQELIDSIESCLTQTGNKASLIKQIKIEIKNSLFER